MKRVCGQQKKRGQGEVRSSHLPGLVLPIIEQVKRLASELDRLGLVLSREAETDAMDDVHAQKAQVAFEKLRVDGIECGDGVVEERSEEGRQVERPELGLACPWSQREESEPLVERETRDIMIVLAMERAR